MVGIDIETTGLDFNRDKIIGVGIRDIFYTSLNQNINLLGPTVLHNGKFDVKFLRKAGINIRTDFDTMLAASLLLDRPQYLDLATLAKHYLGIESWKEDINRKDMGSEEIGKIADYCLKDVAVTQKLALVLVEKLKAQGSYEFYVKYLMPAARLIADVEYRGMRIDMPAIEETKEILTIEIDLLKEKLFSTLGEINLNSPKQLLPALQKLGITPVKYDYKTQVKKPSTDKNVLKVMRGNPTIDALLDYKGKTKLVSFLESWQTLVYDERLYPTYNLCKGPDFQDDSGARTGRLSCSNPNLQQIPRDKTMRSLFIPSPGNSFVIADESQIEPRILAHYSGDYALSRDFTDGIDPYGSFAVEILGANCGPNEVKEKFPSLRAVAKECILSIVYGIGARRLNDRIKTQTGIDLGERKCREIINTYFRKRPKLKQLRDNVETAILHRYRTEGVGYIINIYGRKVIIDVDKIFSTGVNTLIQSSASDICLFSQLPLVNNSHDAKLVAIVHDEVIYEVPKDNAEKFARELETAMTTNVERALNISVPLKAEASIATSWADKK